MYYIIRHGVDRLELSREFRSYTLALQLYHELQTKYERMFEIGKINKYTCLLLTRGTRPNEETKGFEHGSGKGESH